MKEKISSALKERLDSLKPEDEVDVLVMAKLPSNLEAKLKEELKSLPPGNTPERKAIVHMYSGAAIGPIAMYLDNIKAKYDAMPLLFTVHTKLQAKDIFELAKEEAVSVIYENQAVHLVK